MSEKGFKKFKKNFFDQDDNYDRGEYVKRRTPRHRVTKASTAIYAEDSLPKDYRKDKN